MRATLNAENVERRAASFKTWLSTHGASVMVPTNKWEMIRYVGANGLSVIYKKANGQCTCTGDALEAWSAFSRGDWTWRATPRTKRTKKSAPVVRALRDRDGDRCFYCMRDVHPTEASVEHLISTTHGGPDHMSNMFLAHRQCNFDAGNLSAIEKIKRHTAAVVNLMQHKRLPLKSIYEKRSKVNEDERASDHQ